MKRIKIVPYRSVLHITEDFQEWSKMYTRLSGYTAEEGSGGLTYNNLDGNYYVLVADGTICSLVHELAHVCLMVAERAQLGDILKEQEQFCYLLGYLTEESLRALPNIKGV